MAERANILLVDDREENLIALRAILEPLDQNLVLARGGEDALRALLDVDVALILLDVRMPGMDGFETAAFIKRRSRTRHVPIIFLTAEASDAARVFDAYTVGAVDYMLKPFEPHVLRSKVKVFIDLWEKGERIREQEQQLRLAEQEARRHEVDELRRASDERYRNLAEAMPHVVWMAHPDGAIDYVNQQWYRYTGLTRLETDAGGWQVAVHPDDQILVDERWQRSLSTGAPFELEYRFRLADGSHRWQLGRAVPRHDDTGAIAGWIGTSTDIHDRKLLEQARTFMSYASAELATTLDSAVALQHVAEGAVEEVADWCTIDVVEEGGELRRVATAYNGVVNRQLATTLARSSREGEVLLAFSRQVLEGGGSRLVPTIGEDSGEATRDHDEVMRGLGLHSMVAAPLIVRDEEIGVVTMCRGGESGTFNDADEQLAQELGRRLATSIDRSRLYQTAEQRARAATALATVADGVCMVDRAGVVQLWNPAAERISGIDAQAASGTAIERLLPGWGALERDATDSPDPGAAVTVPVALGDREAWLAVSTAPYDEGVVYTFRDITEQRIVDKMKTDFVATVSHELRTPLAAISGAALTLVREDIELDDELRSRLLQIMVDQSDRLSDMIQNVLLASRIESGVVSSMTEPVTVEPIVREVMESARAYAPEGIELQYEIDDDLPAVGADPEHLRQVLANLVENGIKYSPEGGRLDVRACTRDGHVHISVRDHGLGIPRSEHERIFEKFYRLDANMTRGIGGSGLGLYICAELVRLMGGQLAVQSPHGGGTMFELELVPIEGDAHDQPRSDLSASGALPRGGARRTS